MAALALSSTAQLCSSGTGGPLTLAPGMHTIVTDTGEIDGLPSPGWGKAEFNFTDLTIAAGATLTATGNQALILLASGDVDISGTILADGSNGQDASSCAIGTGGAAGPGGGNGGDGGPAMFNGSPGFGPGGGVGGGPPPFMFFGSGGGGAGHLTTGVRGGPVGGQGGAAYSGVAIKFGGSGGGGGCGADMGTMAAGAGGGGGGGIVIVVAAGTLTVSATGAILARGGNGGAALPDCSPVGDCAGPGGGGSGGTIDLRAGLSMPVVSGTLDVSGGLGLGATSCAAFSGNGSIGMIATSVTPCALPPTCMVATPAGTAGNTVVFPLDLQSPSSVSVDVFFEYSLDGGATYQPCTQAATSPLANPDFAVSVGPSSFGWDSRTDSVGVVAIATGVLMRTTVEDGVSMAPGTCVTGPFQVDNTSLCPGLCGDCDQNGIQANISDALRAAQIAVGIIIPSPAELGCCDVDSSGSVTITDALMMALFASGLPAALLCP